MKPSQITKSARAVVFVLTSLALSFVSYILLGWGSVLGGYYGFGCVVLGGLTYFASLLTATRTGMRWLIVGVASLGLLVGAMVLFVCTVKLFTEPHNRLFPALVVLIFIAYCAGFVHLMKARVAELFS
jgi:hypothetical protein